MSTVVETRLHGQVNSGAFRDIRQPFYAPSLRMGRKGSFQFVDLKISVIALKQNIRF